MHVIWLEDNDDDDDLDTNKTQFITWANKN